MSLLSEITFLEVAMSLVAVGIVEQLVHFLPETVVGPKGWLLRTDSRN